MKNILCLGVLASALLLSPTAKADFVQDGIGKVLKMIKSQGGDKLCRKGDASKGIFSVRSFEGKLCTVPYFAAFAELTCGSKSDFQSSGCDKNAIKALGLPEGANRAAIKAAAKVRFKLAQKTEGSSGDMKEICEASKSLSKEDQEALKGLCD